jgi:hypothetical protein
MSSTPLPSPRVGLVVDLREMLEIEVGVDLGRRDIRVSQQFLNRAQITGRLQ